MYDKTDRLFSSWLSEQLRPRKYVYLTFTAVVFYRATSGMPIGLSEPDDAEKAAVIKVREAIAEGFTLKQIVSGYAILEQES
jgi:hypothetical protein